MESSRSLHQCLTIVALGVLASSALPAAAAYKCQGADGKIEYSDRPCEASKNTLSGAQAVKADPNRGTRVALAELNKIFTEFEPPLCEREKLAGDIDRAIRNGELHATPTAWAPKQARLFHLNDQMAVFQERVSKYTRPAGVDSQEIAAVRKFQMALKNCDRPVAKPKLPSEAEKTSATPNKK